MSGLAAGLARGLAMYGQGRMIAEEREAERQRQEAERQRQMAMMKLQQDQFALQREQFEAGQRQTALANKRVAESDTNEAIGKGFRPVGDQWDTFNDLVGIDPSKAETITVNGQTMRKVAPTQAFQQGIIQRREQENELQRKVAEEKQRREQILGTIKDGPMRALAAQLPLDELQKLTSGRLKDMMTPKAGPAPVSMQVIQTADGPMAFNPRTGQAQPITANGQPVGAPQQVGGKMTEGQRRVSGLVGLAEAERRKLEELGTPNWWDRLMARVPGDLGEPLMSDKGQQYMSAAEAFARPYLYSVSGQNATEGEVKSTAKQSIPGVFTRPSTEQDMRERRARMVEGMRGIAGQSGSVNPADAARAQAVDAIRRGADPVAVKRRFEELTGQPWED